MIKIWQKKRLSTEKNKPAHWVKWRKTTVQTFYKRWILRVHFSLLNTFAMCIWFLYWPIHCLHTDWFLHSPVPGSGEQILALLPFEAELTFTGNLKQLPSLEPQQALQMAWWGSTPLPIPLGTVPLTTRNPLSSTLLGMKGSWLSVMNLCPHWIPTPISVLCLNDLDIQAYIRQFLNAIIFFFFTQNSASYGFSPKKYLSTF